MKKYRFCLLLLTVVLSLPFLITLIYDTSLANGIIEPKIFALNIIGTFCVIVFLLFNIFYGQLQTISINRIDISFSLFVFFCAANYFVKYQFNNDSLISFLLIYLLYFIWKAVLNAGGQAGLGVESIVISAFFLIGILECVFAVAQIIGFLPSLHTLYAVTGTFHNPGILGIFLAVLLSSSLTIYLFLGQKCKNEIFLRGLSLLALLLCLIVLPSTNSRDAWLATFISVTIVVCFYFPFIRRRIIEHTLLYIMAFVAFCMFALVSLFYYKPASASGRMVIWKECLISIKKHPLTGIGFNQFANRQPIIQYDYFKEKGRPVSEIMLADKVDYVFNDYIQLTVENGLLGFVLFLFLLYAVSTAYFEGKLYNNPILLSLGIGLLCLLVAAFFSYPFQNVSFWCLFTFFISVISSRTPGRVNLTIARSKLTVVLSVVLVTCCLFLVSIQLKEYSLKKRLFTAGKLLGAGETEDALTEYRDIYLQISHEKQILLSYGKCLFLSGHYKESLDTLALAKKWIEDPFLSIGIAGNYEALGQLKPAEDEYQKSILMIPNRIYPKYLLFKLYLKQSKVNEAAGIAHLILETPIKVVSPAIMEMRGEVTSFLKTQNH